TVNNVAPVLSALGLTAVSVNENGVTSLTGTISDAGTDTFALVINWGDGAPQTISNLASGPFSISHRYLNNVPGSPVSNFTISVSLSDDDGGSAPLATTVATVNDVAPTATIFASQTVTSGLPTSMTGSFTDPGTQDTFAFLWHLVSDTNGQPVGDG